MEVFAKWWVQVVCLPLCVWCCVVWVAMAILLYVECIAILEVAFGGDLLLLGSGNLLGGVAFLSDTLLGVILWVSGNNLVGRLWVVALEGGSLVDRLWGLTLMDEYCGVYKHTRQWCL